MRNFHLHIEKEFGKENMSKLWNENNWLRKMQILRTY